MTNKPKLILVVGHRESGKDTAAAFIEKILGSRRLEMSSLIINDIGIELRQTDLTIRKWIPEHRKLLQAWGQIRKEVDSDYWIKKTLRWVEEQRQWSVATSYIVTGCRYPAEIEYLTKNLADIDVVTIRIIKTGLQPVAYIDSHVSELNVNHIPFDYWFYNDDTILALYEQINTTLRVTNLAPNSDKLYINSRAVQFNEVAYRDSIDRIRGQSYTDWKRGRDNTMADTSESKSAVS